MELYFQRLVGITRCGWGMDSNLFAWCSGSGMGRGDVPPLCCMPTLIWHHMQAACVARVLVGSRMPWPLAADLPPTTAATGNTAPTPS